MPDDGQLLTAYAKNGDVQSLAELVVRHSRWLIAYMRGQSPTGADAEDAVQETWVRVIRSCGSYRGGSVRAYLVRIARSVAIDRFRRARSTVSVDAEGEDGTSLADTMADGLPTPLERVEALANSEDIRLAVRSLPEGHREVLMMRIEGELSFREIAEIMGIPLGTALTWMHVATVRLREILGGAK